MIIGELMIIYVCIYISPNMSELHKFRSMKIWKPGGLALWEAPTNISTNSQRHDVSPWVEATALLSNIIRPVISCIYIFIYLIMYVYTYSNIHIIYIYNIIYILYIYLLVGGFNHLQKYEFVNGKDYNPYIMDGKDYPILIMENKKCSKPSTRFNYVRIHI